MLKKEFFVARVEAFVEAGRRADDRNQVDDCDADDGYVEISRKYELDQKPAPGNVASALRPFATEELGLREDEDGSFLIGDAGDGGETGISIRVDSGNVVVDCYYRKYFGMECRNNSAEDFAGWAKGWSSVFDQIGEIVKGVSA